MIKVMETKTAQVPSHIYLGLAAGAIALSAGMFVVSRRKDIANFVEKFQVEEVFNAALDIISQFQIFFIRNLRT